MKNLGNSIGAHLIKYFSNGDLPNHPLFQTTHIQKVISEYEPDPSDYMLAPEVPIITTDNDRIAVDVRVGAGGMTRGAKAGAQSPTVDFHGRKQFEFEPAEWREKVILAPRDLQKIRRMGTKEEIMAASEVITEKLDTLRMRLENRFEWMRWKALKGSLSYAGLDVTIGPIDYGIPAEMTPTLTGADRWTQTTADIMDDILNWGLYFRDIMPKQKEYLFNGYLHVIIMQNQTMRTLRDTLFQGQANLGNMTPGNLQAIFNHYAGIPYKVFDGGYTEQTDLTVALASSGTSLTVRDVGDLAAGDVLHVTHRDTFVSGRERLTVTAVNPTTKVITVASPGATQAYPIGSTVRAKKFFIDNDEFIIRGQLPGNIEGGSNWAEIVSTTHSYGGNFQNTGIISVVNVHEMEDPPRVEIIVGANALPVVYHPDTNLIASVNG